MAGVDPRPRYPEVQAGRKLRNQFPATWRRELLNARTIPEGPAREAKADEWVLHAHRHGTLHPRDYREAAV